MTIINDIQTIARTKELDDKASKALQEAQAANANVKALIAGERGIAGQNTVNISGSANSAAIDAVSNPPPSDDGTASVNLNPPPSSTPAPNTTNTSTQGPNPNTNINGSDGTNTVQINQATTNGNTINGNANSNTDLSGGGFGGGGSGVIGGSNVVNQAEMAPNDTIKQQLDAQLSSQGATATQIQDVDDQYVQNNYGEPGTFTAQQLADNHAITPALVTDIGSPNAETVKAIIGFEQNLAISDATGKPISVKVQIGANSFPTPTAGDTPPGINPWSAWNVPPDKIGWQLGYYWQVNGLYDGATPGDAINNFMNNAIIPFQPNAYWDNLQQASSTSWTFSYYHNPGDPPINTATCLRVGCAMVPDEFCPLLNPTAEFWPETGSIIVNYTEGQIQTSVYDGEQTLSYTNGGSTIRLHIGNGIDIIDTRYMDIEPAIDGGFLLVVRDSSLNYEFANFYRADGTFARARISLEEYPYYKPKR